MEYLKRSRLPIFTPRLDLTAEDLNAQAETICAAINELAGRIHIIKDMIPYEERDKYAEELNYPILDELLKIWEDIKKLWETVIQNKKECDEHYQELLGDFEDLERRLNALDDAAARKEDLAALIERVKWIKDNSLPTINPDNNHWMIGDIDTGIPATGDSCIYIGPDEPQDLDKTIWINPESSETSDDYATRAYVNETIDSRLGYIEGRLTNIVEV